MASTPVAGKALGGQSGRQTPSAAAGVSPEQIPKTLPGPKTESRSNSFEESLDILEPSIVNIQPAEELTRFVSDFIYVNLNDKKYDNLEVCLFRTANSRLKQSWEQSLM
jgi:hypothetical protein